MNSFVISLFIYPFLVVLLTGKSGKCQSSTRKSETVLMSEVFEIVLEPTLFNWTYNGVKDQYYYQASLKGAPDLPSWINFQFSERHHCAYLYGVPPNTATNGMRVPIDVVAFNRKNFETRQEEIDIIIQEKRHRAVYEVHLKIDNLNVEDMFEVNRMDSLKDVFKKHLWLDSEMDLYLTFLSSATKLGARRPLDPNEPEGVVLRLGSEAPFSEDLILLQKEVTPLWKFPTCPRDFKRTTVERYFRDAGFSLDWCTFRLIDDNNSAMQHSGNKKLDNYEEIWAPVSEEDIPRRHYKKELLTTIIFPTCILIVMAVGLSLALCHRQDAYLRDNFDEASEDFFNNLFHICTDYFSSDLEEDDFEEDNEAPASKQISPLNSLNQSKVYGTQHDFAYSNSPTSTISRGVHCRPSPPPYVRPKYKPTL